MSIEQTRILAVTCRSAGGKTSYGNVGVTVLANDYGNTGSGRRTEQRVHQLGRRIQLGENIEMGREYGVSNSEWFLRAGILKRRLKKEDLRRIRLLEICRAQAIERKQIPAREIDVIRTRERLVEEIITNDIRIV